MQPTHHTESEGLHILANTEKFNKWMYSSIKKYVTGNILEIGSGIGNISKFFILNNDSITLSDTDDFYIDKLKSKFIDYPNVKGIISINLQIADFKTQYSALANQYDCIFLLNVLEHLEDESYAIQNLNFLLKANGTLVILVPAYNFLYSTLDKELNHFRRYTTKNLAAVLQKEQFIVAKSFYFNLMGVPAWLYGKIRKYRSLPSGDMKLFNILTPLGKMLDRITFRKIGLSAIVVAKKPASLN